MNKGKLHKVGHLCKMTEPYSTWLAVELFLNVKMRLLLLAGSISTESRPPNDYKMKNNDFHNYNTITQ